MWMVGAEAAAAVFLVHLCMMHGVVVVGRIFLTDDDTLPFLDSKTHDTGPYFSNTQAHKYIYTRVLTRSTKSAVCPVKLAMLTAIALASFNRKGRAPPLVSLIPEAEEGEGSTAVVDTGMVKKRPGSPYAVFLWTHG